MGKVTPVLNISHFRGRNDNGGESSTGATWKAAVDTDWTQVADQNFRVRLAVEETAGSAVNNGDYHFQYRHIEGTNAWTDILTTSSVVRAFSSTHFTNNDSTTQQISSFTFVTPNEGMTDDGDVNSTADIASSGIEIELCCQIRSADVSNGDTIEIRCTIDGAAPDGTPVIPSITVSVPTSSTMQATTQTYSVTGGTSDLHHAAALDAETRSYSVATQNTLFKRSLGVDFVTQAYSVSPGSADFSISKSISFETQTYSVSGGTVDLLHNAELGAQTQSYSVSGGDANFSIGSDVTFEANTVSFSVTGGLASFDTIEIWTADADHFTVDENLAGQHTADGFHDHTGTENIMTASTAIYTVSGVDVALIAQIGFDVEPASFTVSGGNANFEVTIPAQTQTYSVSTVDADLRASFSLQAETQSFSVAGGDADLDKTLNFPADAASFAISTVDAILKAQYKLDAQNAEFTLSGGDADLNFGYKLEAQQHNIYVYGEAVLNITKVAQPAVFTVTGGSASFLLDQVFQAETQTYTVSVQNTEFLRTENLPLNTQFYTVSGGDANLNYQRKFAAEAQSYVISGVNANLDKEYGLSADTQTYAVTTVNATLTKNVPTDRRIFIIG